MSLFGQIFRVIMPDRKAGKKSVAELKAELIASQSSLGAQLADAADSEKARDKLAHVIGIERWSQSRLKVALGDALTMDEYDGYRPAAGLTLAELTEEFATTRDETLFVADQLAALSNIETETVAHNEMGDVRVRSWLQYIDIHALYELKNVK